MQSWFSITGGLVTGVCIYVLARIAGELDPGIGIYVSDLECQKGRILEFVFMSLVLDSWSTRS